MFDLCLIAIAAFIFGCIAGRSDLRASRRRPVSTVQPALKLVWSKGARKW